MTPLLLDFAQFPASVPGRLATRRFRRCVLAISSGSALWESYRLLHDQRNSSARSRGVVAARGLPVSSVIHTAWHTASTIDIVYGRCEVCANCGLSV